MGLFPCLLVVVWHTKSIILCTSGACSHAVSEFEQGATYFASYKHLLVYQIDEFDLQ